ncbi:hypothetical protein [Streptomyces griseoaurantiacus]|uniref:hypothetical protein n=1 Tax=Streptomyces griseoaurantiacus TaxID=68213 RepID=UPI002E27D59C|nr:hypothetical protein [Streptomyces jietaisiensis]
MDYPETQDQAEELLGLVDELLDRAGRDGELAVRLALVDVGPVEARLKRCAARAGCGTPRTPPQGA